MKPTPLTLMKTAMVQLLRFKNTEATLVYSPRQQLASDRHRIQLADFNMRTVALPRLRQINAKRDYIEAAKQLAVGTPLEDIINIEAKWGWNRANVDVTIKPNFLTLSVERRLRRYVRETPPHKPKIKQAINMVSLLHHLQAVKEKLKADQFIEAGTYARFLPALDARLYSGEELVTKDYPLTSDIFRVYGLLHELLRYHPNRDTVRSMERFFTAVHQQFAFLTNRTFTI